MPRPRRTREQMMRIHQARQADIKQSNPMVELGRFDLTALEYNLVGYAMTLIDPYGSEFQEFTIQLKDFCAICGITNESYTETKKILQGLTDKAWWIPYYDEKHGEGESRVRWFSTARTFERSGEVTVKFHEDMMKHILQQYRLWQEEGINYTTFMFQYLLCLKTSHSKRMYQLLKPFLNGAYHGDWWFPLDELKKRLNCADSYERYVDFRKYVLDPSIREINKYTDITVTYDIHSKDGKRVKSLVFFIDLKSEAECITALSAGQKRLDGDMIYGQQSLFDEMTKTELKRRRCNPEKDCLKCKYESTCYDPRKII